MPQAILLQDVESLGERGTVVDVSPGYLRNYLLPAQAGRARDRRLDQGGRRAAGRPPSAPSGRPRSARARTPPCSAGPC